MVEQDHYLSKDEFLKDLERIHILYQRHGYFDAELVSWNVAPAGDAAEVSLTVFEGEPTFVDTLAIEGLDLLGTAKSSPPRCAIRSPSSRTRCSTSRICWSPHAVVRQPVFRAALASNFVNGWTVYGVRVALVPLFVVEVLHRPDSWSGIALAAFAAGTGATLLLGGRWADRGGRRLPILVGSATVAVTSLWIGLTSGMTELVVVSLLSGVGTGLMSPAVNAAVTDVIAVRGREVNSGAALAGFQMVGDVGAIIGPVVAGMIVERGGYFAAFATTAAIAVVSFVYWLRVPVLR